MLPKDSIGSSSDSSQSRSESSTLAIEPYHLQPVVRKQHNTGYKHKANVRNYYMQFEEAQTQDLIDSKIMEHLARAGAGDAPVRSYLLLGTDGNDPLVFISHAIPPECVEYSKSAMFDCGCISLPLHTSLRHTSLLMIGLPLL